MPVHARERDSSARDAVVARLLATLPAYRRWANQPLDRDIESRLAKLDRQQLLTLTAHALRRVVSSDR